MQTRAGAPTDTGPAFIGGLPSDKRVRRLVHTLNSIPGVTTYSSCGGHRNHSLAQVAAGTFYLELVASSGRVGYRAIQLIVRAIDAFFPDVTLTPWLNGEDICWSLRGRCVSPDDVASAISWYRRADRLMAKRARASQSGPRLGKQLPRYRFFLNPYTDVRFTTCPQCRGKTSQRKLPLVIHIDPMQLVALNKTCRYCPRCDLLIAHQDELEAWLMAFFKDHQPEIVGNDYLVLGTEDRPDWLRGVRTSVFPQEALECLHDFRDVVRFTPPQRWARE